ncbi:DMT family transporter [Streptococcus sp. DD12]|uniref:DMT family transporter n=1 Tax=Streptococcus sp. DD12 TaxID=1777880 RepID=UPI0007953E16|nr:multidrug resistance efflux transporter family protein [Streptococcus sp. DD12]KXT76653.1 putative membrane protein [Streptococcus sp. DD12]
MKSSQFLRALVLGILGALFFSFTFIFNRSMNVTGGFWGWSASLRYVLSLPILWFLVKRKQGLSAVGASISRNPWQWLLWSTIGFGFFYAPLTLASLYGQSWFIAATWQITIVAGVLLSPLFGQKLPLKQLGLSLVVLLGVFVLQLPYLSQGLGHHLFLALTLILIAAFSYPLGNRKMLHLTHSQDLSTLQRVFGMTLMSLPFWLALSLYSGLSVGLPPVSQLMQSLIVALFSGVIATLLFFEATNLVKHHHKQLAIIEATQSGEVVFTLLGGCLFLGDAWPNAIGFLGLALIILGMLLNSLFANK